MKHSVRSLGQLLRYYPRVIKLVWDASRRYTLLTLLFTALSSAVPPVELWLTKVAVDRVIAAIGLSTQQAAPNWSSVLTPVGLLFATWVLGGICGSLSAGLSGLLADRVGDHTQTIILEKASSLDIAFYDSPTFYDRMANAKREYWRATGLTIQSWQVLARLLSLLGTLGLLLRLHPVAALVLLVTAAPQFVVGSNFTNRWSKLIHARTREERMASYLSNLLVSRQAVKEVRLFQLDKPLLERFRHSVDEFFGQKAIQLSRQRANSLLVLLSAAGTVGVWAHAVVRATLGRISIGDLALVFQAARQTRDAFAQIVYAIGFMYEHTLFLGNLFTFLELRPDAVEGALTRPGTTEGRKVRARNTTHGALEFSNVSFRYPGSNAFVLGDLSFALQPGQTVALVGENGAGKTTLVKLLARLYDPIEGAILLDGIDLRECDPVDLRREMGVIFQDFMRYDLSVRDNVGFGQVELIGDQQRLEQAADKGGALSLIQSLPQGFDTMLGKTFDEGVDLSGGEWQKIALSRAFMRDARILILDEPTTSLDAMAEYEVYKRFAELSEGKTTILISHRFSTVRMADRILVLKEGRLIEQGTHVELMALGGHYSTMFNMQAERYR